MSGNEEIRNQIANEKYGKDFDELDPMDRIKVGGAVGGESNSLKRMGKESHAGDTELRDKIANEKFGKNFDDLEPMDRIRVGGTLGGLSGSGGTTDRSE